MTCRQAIQTQTQQSAQVDARSDGLRLPPGQGRVFDRRVVCVSTPDRRQSISLEKEVACRFREKSSELALALVFLESACECNKEVDRYVVEERVCVPVP